MELISLPLVLLLISNIHSQKTEDITPTLTVQPQKSVFIGDSVTLICEIHQSTGWEFIFITPSNPQSTETTGTKTKTIRSVRVSDGGEYRCIARRIENPHVYTQYSKPITLTVQDKPTLSVQSQKSVFIGDTVTLICQVPQSTRWEFIFIKHPNTEFTETTGTKIIKSVQVSDGGEYWCQARKENPHVYTQYSDSVTVTVQDVKPTLTVQPQTSVFIGDSVTLICEVDQSTGWEFIFINPSNTESTETTGTKIIRSVRVSDGGEYKCRAGRGNPQIYTQYSKPITVTVQKRPTPQVFVWPDYLLFRGETVNLRCVINGGGVSSWQYSWYKDSIIQQNKLQYYTIRSVIESDAGKYTCRGTEIRGSRYSNISDEVTLRVSGVSPSVSLIIRPNRSQHFSSESLSLSCEDHSNSTGWTVRRYTDKLESCSSSDWRSTGTTSTCTIRYLITSDTGVYWCQSESGEKLHPVNISVHNVDVILDSPVHPVTEGDNLTLRCLYRDKKPSNLTAEFYKDGSLVQNQTTGDMMIISTVSKSHEGFYYCKHPERGESPKSWISVRVSGLYQVMSGLKILSFLLAVCPYLLSTVVLVIKCCRLRGESSV